MSHPLLPSDCTAPWVKPRHHPTLTNLTSLHAQKSQALVVASVADAASSAKESACKPRAPSSSDGNGDVQALPARNNSQPQRPSHLTTLHGGLCVMERSCQQTTSLSSKDVLRCRERTPAGPTHGRDRDMIFSLDRPRVPATGFAGFASLCGMLNVISPPCSTSGTTFQVSALESTRDMISISDEIQDRS
jgi:hypothetical protein